jgi:hypothetical protein
MVHAILSVCSPEELEDGSSSEDEVVERALINQATAPDARAKRRREIRNKILAVGRFLFILKSLRYVTTPTGGHILTWDTYSERSENASGFNVASVEMDDPRNSGTRDGMNALGVRDS